MTWRCMESNSQPLKETLPFFPRNKCIYKDLLSLNMNHCHWEMITWIVFIQLLQKNTLKCSLEDQCVWFSNHSEYPIGNCVKFYEGFKSSCIFHCIKADQIDFTKARFTFDAEKNISQCVSADIITIVFMM